MFPKVPSGELEFDPPRQKKPALQGPSGMVLFSSLQYIPGEQGMQANMSLAPIIGLKVLGGQGSGKSVPFGQNEPGWHNPLGGVGDLEPGGQKYPSRHLPDGFVNP